MQAVMAEKKAAASSIQSAPRSAPGRRSKESAVTARKPARRSAADSPRASRIEETQITPAPAHTQTSGISAKNRKPIAAAIGSRR